MRDAALGGGIDDPQNVERPQRPVPLGRLSVITRSDKARGLVELSVVDSGQGLAECAEERLFHPFATTKHGGLGLGLLLSRRAVERWGGTLEVKGGAGMGMLAIIRMPVAS